MPRKRARVAQNNVLVALQHDLFGGHQPVAHAVVGGFADHGGDVQAADFLQQAAVGQHFAAQIKHVGFVVEGGGNVGAVADTHHQQGGLLPADLVVTVQRIFGVQAAFGGIRVGRDVKRVEQHGLALRRHSGIGLIRGDELDVAHAALPAETDAAHGDLRVFRPGLATDDAPFLHNADGALHAGQGFDLRHIEHALVAHRADNRAFRAARNVFAQTLLPYGGHHAADIFLAGVRLHDDNHKNSLFWIDLPGAGCFRTMKKQPAPSLPFTRANK